MLYFFPIFIGFCMNALMSPLVNTKAKKRLLYPFRPLPDSIHDLVPPIPLFSPDIFLAMSLCYGLILGKTNEFEKNILCMGHCSIIRSLTVGQTIMPSCMPYYNIFMNQSLYATYFLSTHDLMFSGHTILFIGIGNIINSNIIIILGPLLSICSRQHYTIDVCVSYLVYYTVYTFISDGVIALHQPFL